ncbi:hypothetical protein IFR05_001481 [Cadophora sp. M221]|nr:hypothetical protein IFR05_001481 [Cadophora sp. M221]
MASTPAPTASSASPAAERRPQKKQKPDKLPFDLENMCDLVTFYIGPAKKKAIVHKSIVCQASPVLEAAFDSLFIEGQTQVYELEDTTEAAFVLFVQWIYRGRIKLVKGLAQNDDKSHEELRIKQAALADLWILAEKLLIPELQNRAIDLIEGYRLHYGLISKYMAQKAYDNTCVDSPLQRYLVYVSVWMLEVEAFRRSASFYPHAMLVDIATLSRQCLISGSKFSSDMSQFHVECARS